MSDMEQTETTDHLGMTETQWAQWQAYTRGYGEQDENGVDVSLLRQNLRLTPTERLTKLQRGLRFFKEDSMESVNDFQQVIAALQASGLRFVIIGGIAMRLQGAAHMTDDIDFAFARDTENLEALVNALAPYHPRLRGVPPGLPFFWDVRALKTSVNMTLETDLGNVDLLGEPAGIASFEYLWEDATVLSVQGLQVRVASVSALIAMKRAAGRPKDQAHLMELERLRELTAHYDAQSL
jgi:predicted nucleotidyltransferase